jgi:hypothetical protein
MDRRRKKIEDGDTTTGRWEYLVHYQGWKSKWDAWMTNESIFKQNEENLKLCSESFTGTVGQGPGHLKKVKAAEKARLQAEKKCKREDARQKKIQAKAAAKQARDAARASSKAAAIKKRPGSKDKAGSSSDNKPQKAPKLASERIRKTSAEILRHKKAQRTALPPILEMQLGRDYGLVQEDGRLIQLPRKPSVVQVLNDFLGAKMKSVQSKLSKDKREDRDGGSAPSLSAHPDATKLLLPDQGRTTAPSGLRIEIDSKLKGGKTAVLSDGATVQTISVEVRRRAFRLGTVLTALVSPPGCLPLVGGALTRVSADRFRGP